MISKITSIIIAVFQLVLNIITGCHAPVNTVTTNTNLDICLSNKNCNSNLAIGHRGVGFFGLWAPENTLAAFETAWKAGADIIEMDVSSTSDGELVIIHDDSVDRTTHGKGRVSDMTFKDIRKLKIKSLNWDIPEQTIPTLTESLKLLRGKTVVCLCIRTDDIRKIVNAIEEQGMINASFLLISSIEQGLKARQANPKVALMPIVNNLNEIKQYIKALDPIFLFDISIENITPQIQSFIKEHSLKISIDAFGANENYGVYGFKNLLDKGAALIQTDRLDILVPMLQKEPSSSGKKSKKDFILTTDS